MIQRRDLLSLFIVASIVILLRLPSIVEPLDNDSGAIAYHSRLILRGEPLYSTHHTGHHLPAGYYSYVLAFLIFGDQPAAPKLLLIPWLVACAWVLYGMGCLLIDRWTGFIAAIFFAFLISHMFLKGMTAETELFANLPLSAGVFLSLFIVKKRALAWNFFWVGILASAAVMYKAIYVAPLVVGVFIILGDFWLNRESKGIKILLEQLAWLFAGLAVPVLLVLAYFAHQGILDRFLLVFQLGVQYTKVISTRLANVTLPIGVFPILFMAFNNPILLVLGLVGSFRLLRSSFPIRSVQAVVNLGLALWLYLSFAQAGITGVGFAHYVLLVVPPLVFISSLEIKALGNMWRNRLPVRRARLMQWLLVAAVIGYSMVLNNSIYIHYVKYKLGLESYNAFLTGHFGTGKIYLRVMKIAAYIQENTSPNEPVFYWGDDVQFYYLANRRAAVEIIWPDYIQALGLYEEVRSSQPRYIIVTDLLWQDRPEWLEQVLQESYNMEKTFDNQQVYKRK